MKKTLVFVITLFLSLFITSSTAFAADARVVSGPSGASASGWYKGPPSVVVDSVPSCPSGIGNVSLYLSPSGGGVQAGRHHVTLRAFTAESWMGKGPYVAIEDKSYATGITTGTNVWACPALGMPNGPTDPVNIWDGDVNWDNGMPSLSVSSPENNANIDSSSVKVSGSVSDDTSGVQSLVINGVNASISGTSFSASIPVNNGLNTLTVSATDFAGNVTTVKLVVNRISSCGSGGCNATAGDTTTSSGSGNNAVTSTGATKSEDGAKKNDNETADPTPTIVKGVVQGGIGLATILAFVIVLLLLDKFRIIEIKAFHNITDRFAKDKSAKKSDKKSN